MPDHGCPEGLIHQDLFYGRALAHVALVERLQYPPWDYCEKIFQLRYHLHNQEFMTDLRALGIFCDIRRKLWA